MSTIGFAQHFLFIRVHSHMIHGSRSASFLWCVHSGFQASNVAVGEVSCFSVGIDAVPSVDCRSSARAPCTLQIRLRGRYTAACIVCSTCTAYMGKRTNNRREAFAKPQATSPRATSPTYILLLILEICMTLV